MFDRRGFLALASTGAAAGLAPASLAAILRSSLADMLHRELHIELLLAQGLMARILDPAMTGVALVPLVPGARARTVRERRPGEAVRLDCGVALFVDGTRVDCTFNVSLWSLGPVAVRAPRASGGALLLTRCEGAARSLRFTA